MKAPGVLLIDGDPDSLNIYSILLEHHGYRVLRAEDGDEGLRMAAEMQPRLIIVEPFTPCRREGGVLDALHEDPATAHIVVIVLTASPAFLISTRSALPADRLFTKPMQPRDLLNEVARFVALPPPFVRA
jgi:CheY-like chemotaxis protein